MTALRMVSSIAQSPADSTPNNDSVWSTIKRTRIGRVRKEVKEYYLQPSFPCGLSECETCCNDDCIDEMIPLNIDEEEPIIILDLPILMHEADLLWDDPLVNNCIILQSLLSEVTHALHTL